MTVYPTGKHRAFHLIVAALLVVLGVFRLADKRNDPYDGYLTDGTNTVVRVDAGGPAELAGLRVGDRIRSTDDVFVEDNRARARQDRARIGEETTLVVESSGDRAFDKSPATRSLSFKHAAPPADYAPRYFAGFLIGLCFLLCGLMAGQRVPTRSARALVLAGFCLGATFLGTPYFNSYPVRKLAQALLGVALVTGFAALFQFMLEFPKPKSFLRRKHALKILYGPAVLIALFLLFLVIVQPRGTGALNQWSNVLFGLFLVVYFGGAAAAMLHSYLKASPLERARYGLHLEMVGILFGVLPVTIEILLGVLVPKLSLPGSDFYYLTVAFIPIALFLAMSRQRRALENVDGAPSGS